MCDTSAVADAGAEMDTSDKTHEVAKIVQQEPQRRKRARPRRKRKLGKGPFRKLLPASVRAQQVRHQMFVNGQPVAPYNTTQFLIEDHGDLQNIDAQLSNAPGGQKHGRTRDSSFSIDSDDDYFYSSPEDEEEFLTKEFSLEYQDLHVERLNSLSKSDIIRDYLLLEGKYEKAMGELRKVKGDEPGKVTDSGRDTDASSRSDGDVNEQLKLGHVEIRRLKAEVEKLKRENAQLHSDRRDSESSVDSESDSSSSSSTSVSSSTTAKSSPKSSAVSPKHVENAEEVAATSQGPPKSPTPGNTAPSSPAVASEVHQVA